MFSRVNFASAEPGTDAKLRLQRIMELRFYDAANTGKRWWDRQKQLPFLQKSRKNGEGEWILKDELMKRRIRKKWFLQKRFQPIQKL
jgi:hypothetical protein